MNGFDQEETFGGPTNPEYVYVPHSESKPYFEMAHEGVLADRMFQSHLDESFVSHQYIIAAQAGRAVNLPYGYWGCDGGKSDQVATLTDQRTIKGTEQTCFDYNTLGDELDKAGLSWHFYTSTLNGDGGEWSGYQAINHIRYGSDWANDVITPQTQFITDIQGGYLANVTWITPICANSDHVNCGGGTGPEWVALACPMRSAKARIWNNTRDLHRNGTTGAVSTATFLRLFSTSTDWASEYRSSSCRRTRRRTSSRTCSTKPAVCCALPRDQFGLGRMAAQRRVRTRPRRTPSNFKKPPRASYRLKPPKHDLQLLYASAARRSDTRLRIALVILSPSTSLGVNSAS